MKLRLQALLSLHLNYKWRGVYVWLKARHCSRCGRAPDFCLRTNCPGRARLGYQRILSEPKKVIQEQHAIAEGVFV